MAEDKDEQWLWRGKHLRQPTTLVGKILADLEFLTSQHDPDVTGGFDPNSKSWVRMNGMRVDRMFDLDEYHFKERLLRVHFLVSALFCATLYVASKYLWQEDHIGYLAVSGAAAICL